MKLAINMFHGSKEHVFVGSTDGDWVTRITRRRGSAHECNEEDQKMTPHKISSINGRYESCRQTAEIKKNMSPCTITNAVLHRPEKARNHRELKNRLGNDTGYRE